MPVSRSWMENGTRDWLTDEPGLTFVPGEVILRLRAWHRGKQRCEEGNGRICGEKREGSLHVRKKNKRRNRHKDTVNLAKRSPRLVLLRT